MTSCECGLTYCADHLPDEIAHRHWHDEYRDGPVISPDSLPPVIASVEGLRVMAIDATTPPATRRQFAKVAYVAQHEMPDYPAGYDGTVTEADERMFVALDGHRIVAFVLIAQDAGHWLLQWDGPSVRLAVDARDETLGWKVARVWTAKRYRRWGIASALLGLASSITATAVADFSWELPLTRAGEAFLRRICPSDWRGRGDAFALRETLSGER